MVNDPSEKADGVSGTLPWTLSGKLGTGRMSQFAERGLGVKMLIWSEPSRERAHVVMCKTHAKQFAHVRMHRAVFELW